MMLLRAASRRYLSVKREKTGGAMWDNIKEGRTTLWGKPDTLVHPDIAFDSQQAIYEVTALWGFSPIEPVDDRQDDNFPRATLAQNVGVRGAFSFPIKNGDEILYILEFFSVEPEQISPPVIELMKQLSVQISRKFAKND